MMKWTVILISVAILGVAVLFKLTMSLYDDNTALRDELTLAHQTLAERDKALTNIRQQIQHVQQLDHDKTEELHYATQKMDRLERDVRRAHQRLFAHASCSNPMPHQSTTARVDDERACELNRTARTDYFRLRREIQRTRSQLMGLQAYIRLLPETCVMPSRQTSTTHE